MMARFGDLGEATLIEAPSLVVQWFAGDLKSVSLFSAGGLLKRASDDESHAVQCLITTKGDGPATCPHGKGDVVTVVHRAGTAFVMAPEWANMTTAVLASARPH